MSNKKGFTLIELLIVIVIIGILSVAVVPKVLDYPKKARDAQRKQSIATLQTAMSMALSESSTITGVNSNNSTCLDNTALATALKPYLNGNLPVDPLPQKYFGTTTCNNYWYVIAVDPQDPNHITDYAFIAALETNSGNYDNNQRPSASDLINIDTSSKTTGKYYIVKATGL